MVVVVVPVAPVVVAVSVTVTPPRAAPAPSATRPAIWCRRRVATKSLTCGAPSAAWLAPPGELFAAVALAGDRVVGHVALHPADGPQDDPALAGWQRATGRSPEHLAVVSRLFTDRSVPGAGTLLLARAVGRAAEADRTAVLLVDPDAPARAFYGRRGWAEVGTAVQQWGHRTVEAVLMVPLTAPGARTRRPA